MPDSLEEYLYFADKALAQEPIWADSKENFELTASLSIGGVVTDGLQIKCRANKHLPNRDVSIMLAYIPSKQRPRLLERIDWRPFNDHNNKGVGPLEWRYVMQEGSHCHAFELNWIADETRLRAGNLPVATPLRPDPETFEELLDRAQKSFRIVDLSSELAAPPWESDLFSNG